MNIIFLDIDGVLNVVSGENGIKDNTFFKYGSHMDKQIVENFNNLLSDIDIKIVISSSWRSDMEDLKYNLEINGFKHWDKIIGKTEWNNKYRGEQILDFLNSTSTVNDFLIIDDTMGDICNEENNEYCFIPPLKCLKINSNKGITEDDISYIKKYFKGK